MFLAKYPDINSSDLDVLLECHAQAAMRGHLPEMRRRWDIMGSFYFVCTLISTIGKIYYSAHEIQASPDGQWLFYLTWPNSCAATAKPQDYLSTELRLGLSNFYE